MILDKLFNLPSSLEESHLAAVFATGISVIPLSNDNFEAPEIGLCVYKDRSPVQI